VVHCSIDARCKRNAGAWHFHSLAAQGRKAASPPAPLAEQPFRQGNQTTAISRSQGQKKEPERKLKKACPSEEHLMTLGTAEGRHASS